MIRALLSLPMLIVLMFTLGENHSLMITMTGNGISSKYAMTVVLLSKFDGDEFHSGIVCSKNGDLRNSLKFRRRM